MGLNHSVRKTVLISKPSFSEESFRHPPQDLVNHSAEIDHHGRLWVYGGRSAAAKDLVSEYNDELRYYDIASNEWRVVFFSGGSPGVRMGHRLYAQPLLKKLHLFAGKDEEGNLQADIYTLSLETLDVQKEPNAVFEASSTSDAVGFIDVDRARFNIIYEPFNMISMCSVIFDDVQSIRPRGEMPEFSLRTDAMIVSGRHAYFFGEESEEVKVYALHLDTFIWRKVATRGNNPLCHGHYTVSAFGTRVILFGALEYEEHRKKWFKMGSKHRHCHCFFLDLETKQWEKHPHSFSWRQGHTASLYESELYILGGNPENAKETLIKLTFTDDAVLEDPVAVEWGELLGVGSYGETFSGKYHESRVALKRLKYQDQVQDTKLRHIIERYVKIHKAVHHPHIVPLLKANIEKNNTFFMTEKAQKGNLCRMVQSKHRFVFQDILEFSLCISDAIGHLHNSVPPVIHGHLCCENVLVFPGNVLKVSDFGLSAVRTASKDGSFKEHAAYLSPETLMAIQDQEGDEEEERTTASDVYAIGVLMWVLLHRSPHPFRASLNNNNNNNVDVDIDVDGEPVIELPEIMERVLDKGERPKIAALTELPCYSAQDEDNLRDYIYLMKKCWSSEPKDRPKAGEVSFCLKWIMGHMEDNNFHRDVWGPVEHGALEKNPQVWDMHAK